MYSDSSEFANGFISGQTSANNSCNGNGGMNGWGWGAEFIWLIVILAMFGWGNGFGNNGWGGGNGGGGAVPYMVGSSYTDSALQRGFDTQTIIGKLDGINSGICSLGYDQLAQMNGLSAQVATGFANVGNAICNSEYQNAALNNATNIAIMQGNNALSTQLAECCCKNSTGQMQIINAIDSSSCSLGRSIERGFCDNAYALATNTTSIIQNAHNDTDRVLAKLDAMEMSRKDETIAALRQQLQAADLAASQAAQNNYLVNTLRPCPSPAYITCNPWGGQANYGSCGCNSGCGC